MEIHIPIIQLHPKKECGGMNNEQMRVKAQHTRVNPLKDLVIGKKYCNKIPAINGISKRMKGASFQIWE
jgi:hypothetical protein